MRERKKISIGDLNDDQKRVLLTFYSKHGESTNPVYDRIKPETLARTVLDYQEGKPRGEQYEEIRSNIVRYQGIVKELESMGLVTSKKRLKDIWQRETAFLRDGIYIPGKIEEFLKDSYVITRVGSQLAEELKAKRRKTLAQVVSSITFLLAGLFFLTFPDFTTTGNVIGNSTGTDISFFLSLGLMIIGGFLLFQSFKK